MMYYWRRGKGVTSSYNVHLDPFMDDLILSIHFDFLIIIVVVVVVVLPHPPIDTELTVFKSSQYCLSGI